MQITFDDIYEDPRIRVYIERADESLKAMGYTEHSYAHVNRVAAVAYDILTTLGYSEHEAELAKIAGYLHDIGNVVNRLDHAQSGAIMAFRILEEMGVDSEDVATIVTAIGNHDESSAYPVNPVAAALILADKTDVRASRVRNKEMINFDIHDRVNYSVKKAEVEIRKDECIKLKLMVDTDVCSVMDYFEIFMQRMLLCRRAAEVLNLQFKLDINEQQIF